MMDGRMHLAEGIAENHKRGGGRLYIECIGAMSADIGGTRRTFKGIWFPNCGSDLTKGLVTTLHKEAKKESTWSAQASAGTDRKEAQREAQNHMVCLEARRRNSNDSEKAGELRRSLCGRERIT